MLFHDVSKYIYDWMKRQQHVKEESLTDWLLYNISQQCNFIYYQAFSRHEESQNGSDWEWWILTSDSSGRHKFNAYRFLVQAKKLLPNNNDNFPLISYGNKNGLQIDLLINFAKNRNALPLYAYYSIGQPDVLEQIKNVDYVDESVLRWCECCDNGCYLTMASDMYSLFFKRGRRKIVDSELLNHSFKLSILDILNQSSKDDVDKILNDFNLGLLRDGEVDGRRYSNLGIYGIKHDEKSIPHYLKVFIQGKRENMEWFENEMRITDISGLGIIDLRE